MPASLVRVIRAHQWKRSPRISIARTRALALWLAANTDETYRCAVPETTLLQEMGLRWPAVARHLRLLDDPHRLFRCLNRHHGVVTLEYIGPRTLTAEQRAAHDMSQRSYHPWFAQRKRSVHH